MNLTPDQAVVVAISGICIVLVDIIKKAAAMNNDNMVRLMALLLGIAISAFYYSVKTPPMRWQEIVWISLVTGVATVVVGAVKAAVPDKRDGA